MQLELQISKEMTIWDDSFKYVSEVAIGVGRPNKTFKGGFHLEPHLGFPFKLEHLYFFYPS